MKLKLFTLLALLLAFKADAQIIDTLYTSSVTHCSNIGSMTVYNDTVFFIGNDTPRHIELWKVWKGATPVRLTNMLGIHSKLYIDGRPDQQHIAAHDGSLIFCGQDTIHGAELWKYDMASGNYQMLVDLVPGKMSSNPRRFHFYNGQLYFSAATADHGSELYSLSIGNNNVSRLTDINPGNLSSNPDHITGFGSKLYMGAADSGVGQELYEYDIVTGKSKLIADINPGNQTAFTKNSSDPSSFAMLGNKLYFTAYTVADGRELYCYDGKSTPIKIDLNPGTGNGLRYTLGLRDAITVFKGSLYFCGYTNGAYALLKYDTSNGKTTAIAYATRPNQATSIGVQGIEIYKNNLYVNLPDTTIGVGGSLMLKYDGSGNPPVLIGRFSLGGQMVATSHALYFNAGMLSRKDKIYGTELVRYTDTSTANPPTNIEETILDGAVTVYPNPSQDITHLQLKLNKSHTLNISVTDFNGRQVYNNPNRTYEASTHTVDIPMHNLPQGNYIYCVKDDTGHMMAGGLLQKL
jgi:ELWxxDGT repeat protein